MQSHQKVEIIKPWINPKERVTVDFNDAQGLNAQIDACTENVVHLIFQEVFPHMKERVTIPLRNIEVDTDPYHYNRDPSNPIQNRLRLRVNQNRPDDI